jgi:hypothetical protein
LLFPPPPEFIQSSAGPTASPCSRHVAYPIPPESA